MPSYTFSRQLIIIAVVIVLGAWFLLDQKRPFLEKIGIIVAVVLLYAGFRYLSGDSIQDILAPILQK